MVHTCTVHANVGPRSLDPGSSGPLNIVSRMMYGTVGLYLASSQGIKLYLIALLHRTEYVHELVSLYACAQIT